MRPLLLDQTDTLAGAWLAPAFGATVLAGPVRIQLTAVFPIAGVPGRERGLLVATSASLVKARPTPAFMFARVLGCGVNVASARFQQRRRPSRRPTASLALLNDQHAGLARRRQCAGAAYMR
jgi:hypothetical protein